MSLATTGGGGLGGAGGGGLMMAHNAHSAGQQGQAVPPPTTGGGPPPLLGGNIVDKQQVSLKQAKSVAHLPLVGVDLSTGWVASVPGMPAETAKGVLPVATGKLPQLCFAPTETSHKTLRKYLSRKKTFQQLTQDDECLLAASSKGSVVVESPENYLGLRRLGDKKTHAIEEASAQVGVTAVNSTLDGSASTGDDFDRVVLNVKLVASKKVVAVLPEEAVQMRLHQAQAMVRQKQTNKKKSKKEGANDDGDDDYTEYPTAIALPAWSLDDAAVEAILECPGCTVFPRSICAVAGNLVPPVDGKPTALLQRIFSVRKASQLAHQRKETETWEEVVTLVMVSVLADGVEVTALTVATEMNSASGVLGDYNVLANVSYKGKDRLGQAVKEVDALVEASDADGPTAIVLYGNGQDLLAKDWKKAVTEEWKLVPVFSTSPQAVSLGAAVLGGVTHGRATRMEGKTSRKLAIQVQHVCPVATAVKVSYHGGQRWEPVKVLFDFDRRIPAKYVMDWTAAECAVLRLGQKDMSDEAFMKATREKEGQKGIPERVKAALDLRVQVLQKRTRDAEWHQVGDVLKPLTQKVDEGSDDALESIQISFSLGINGMLTTARDGTGESVAQATVSARNSALRYYIGIGAAILFFGGFMGRSYYFEYAFNRDVNRVLAFYKHVIPGSMSDGDKQNARYLVYKYNGKRDKLWRLLERKYGEPVLHAHEWPDEPETSKESSQDEENVDLDDEDDEKEEGYADKESQSESDEL